MVRLQRHARAIRGVLWLGIGLGVVAPTGCGEGEAEKPKVKAGDASTTYNVPPPPPTEGKSVADPKQSQRPGGMMSARELRDFRRKQQQGPP
jgi:hypothetical protein